jgi:hypothetical protein
MPTRMRGQRCCGMLIQIFWCDHALPHFHALYAEHEARIDIRTLEVIDRGLPRRALARVLEWSPEHRAELMDVPNLCAQIAPYQGARDMDRGMRISAGKAA